MVLLTQTTWRRKSTFSEIKKIGPHCQNSSHSNDGHVIEKILTLCHSNAHPPFPQDFTYFNIVNFKKGNLKSLFEKPSKVAFYSNMSDVTVIITNTTCIYNYDQYLEK